MTRRRLVSLVLVAVLAFGACGGKKERADLASTATGAASKVLEGAGDSDAETPEELAEATRKAHAAQSGSAGGGDGAAGAEVAGGTTTPTTWLDPASHPNAPKNPSPMRYGQPQHPQKDTVPVALSVDAASCAKIGGVLKVTVSSEPDVDVAMIVGFSDGKDHGAQALGTTGPEGRLVVELSIGPEAPPGRADLLVVASAPDGRRNKADRELTIVKASGSCA